MSEEIKQKEERFEDNWLVFCDIVNSKGDTQAKNYLNSFIQSEIELALQKRDGEILEYINSFIQSEIELALQKRDGEILEYINSFIQSEIELALQKRDGEILEYINKNYSRSSQPLYAHVDATDLAKFIINSNN